MSINPGPNPVVDKTALFNALRQKRIRLGVIDTWYSYSKAQQPMCPPSEFDCATSSNPLMTPHMSGWSEGMIGRRQFTMAENIRRPVKGQDLINRTWPNSRH